MPYEQLPPNYPGQQPSAGSLNDMQRAMQAAGRLSGDANTGVRQSAAGFAVIDQNYHSFYAIIKSGTNPYAWTQAKEQDNGTFASTDEGRSGTTTDWPAYPMNGSTAVPANTIVKMFKAAAGDFYWFISDLGTGGGGGGGFTGTKPRVTAVSCTAGALSVTSITDTYNNGDLQ
jgi:hypothetical protein